ncbi:hypothetical protein AHAS_Ahas17G0147200 [Arachis hypogaea]
MIFPSFNILFLVKEAEEDVLLEEANSIHLTHHGLKVKCVKLKILTGAPELYPDLVALNVIPSIVDLLNHDNTNIAIDVVQLLQDLTDEDVLDNNDEPAKVLVDALIENSVLELLVQILHRLNNSDPDDFATVYATLAMIESDRSEASNDRVSLREDEADEVAARKD